MSTIQFTQSLVLQSGSSLENIPGIVLQVSALLIPSLALFAQVGLQYSGANADLDDHPMYPEPSLSAAFAPLRLAVTGISVSVFAALLAGLALLADSLGVSFLATASGYLSVLSILLLLIVFAVVGAIASHTYRSVEAISEDQPNVDDLDDERKEEAMDAYREELMRSEQHGLMYLRVLRSKEPEVYLWIIRQIDKQVDLVEANSSYHDLVVPDTSSGSGAVRERPWE